MAHFINTSKSDFLVSRTRFGVCVCVCVCVSLIPLQRCSRCILPPQLTGASTTGVQLLNLEAAIQLLLDRDSSLDNVETSYYVYYDVYFHAGITVLDAIGAFCWARSKGLELTLEVPVVFWRCLWCNGYRRRKWTRRHEFKSWTRMIAFHIALIPLGKV